MRIMDALRFAADRHAGQKYGGIDGLPSYPYIHHCASVVIILQQFGVTDEDILMAGACHDVLEDTNTTAWEVEKAIGGRAASIVELVSNPDNVLTYSTTDGKEHSVYLFEHEEWVSPEDFDRLVFMKNKLSRIQKHEIQYPKIATDPFAVIVKLADRIANIETGGKIEMYRKEYKFFRNTLKPSDGPGWVDREPSQAEYGMWRWLDKEMRWGLTNDAA
jgi:(p)ppGpp synthase/HD superfamily hydrolase